MVKYAGEDGDDREAARRFGEARKRLEGNRMFECDTCHIPYPEPLMVRTQPDKLCKGCNIKRFLEPKTP